MPQTVTAAHAGCATQAATMTWYCAGSGSSGERVREPRGADHRVAVAGRAGGEPRFVDHVPRHDLSLVVAHDAADVLEHGRTDVGGGAEAGDVSRQLLVPDQRVTLDLEAVL